MAFKLKVGDVCKLTIIIPGIYRCDDWKTGMYRVTRIDVPVEYGKRNEDIRTHSYRFEKIKKDGTAYKNFINGYNCQAWDKKIDAGEVEIVGVDNVRI